ncbi:hypothetical protein PG994_013435 [Apiospora phragmitis]|uniref:Oxidase ustYa n=1 Tax=Apiospora phragmitis TaxID=2905665 RepID=A0ABR1T939_9PEZI
MTDREELLSAASRDDDEKYEWNRAAAAQGAKWSERRTCMTTLQTFSWLVNMVLLTINTIGLLYLIHYAGAGRFPGSASPIQVGGDYTNAGPTSGSNFGEDEKVYNTTSATHQIHCVYIMGKIFSSVLSNSTDIGIPSDYEAHFLHCVDYMRQAAMCAGDVAIEPRDDNGSPGPVTLENAFNGYHVCKNYGQVKSYLEGEPLASWLITPIMRSNKLIAYQLVVEQVKDGLRNILPIDD